MTVATCSARPGASPADTSACGHNSGEPCERRGVALRNGGHSDRGGQRGARGDGSMTQQEQGRGGTGSLQAEASRWRRRRSQGPRGAGPGARARPGRPGARRRTSSARPAKRASSLRQEARGVVDALREAWSRRPRRRRAPSPTGSAPSPSGSTPPPTSCATARPGSPTSLRPRAREIDALADAVRHRGISDLAARCRFRPPPAGALRRRRVAAGFALTRSARLDGAAVLRPELRRPSSAAGRARAARPAGAASTRPPAPSTGPAPAPLRHGGGRPEHHGGCRRQRGWRLR